MKINIAMMTKLNNFLSPTKIIFGNGAVNQVGDEVKKLGGQKALIVTDNGVVKAGLVSSVEGSLKTQKIDFGVFDKVEAEPPARIVDECARVILEKEYDIVIGIGGGSSLDVAKGAAILAVNGGRVLDYVGVDTVPCRGLPKILIATTSGTGSEVTRAFVVIDEADNLKKSVHSDFNLADVAIVDPMLMISMPPVVTADTGMDALVHAIEAYVSVGATPFSDILAIEAIGLIAENLPLAYAKGNNIEARFSMALASTLAGLAFTSGGLGIVHALSNSLGTEYHLTHGRANAVMLPYVVERNRIGSPNKYARIAKAMGENIERLSAYDAAGRLVNNLLRLLELLGIPGKISAYGVTQEDIPKFAAAAVKMTRLFVWNPREVTEEDVKGIYTAAL